MRKYNVENYIRYKNDVEQVNSRLPEDILGDTEAVKVRYLYLVENLARKFSTGQAASGVLDITDLIQEGSYGLIAAANKNYIYMCLRNACAADRRDKNQTTSTHKNNDPMSKRDIQLRNDVPRYVICRFLGETNLTA